MSLGNPFCVTYSKKLEGNRICGGFGSLNNFSDSNPPDVNFATGVPFPYDGYGLRSHISLIFTFNANTTIRKIQGACYRIQIGTGAGAERTTGTTRLYDRIIGFRGLGQTPDFLTRTIFDPLGWSKDDAVIRTNVAGITGIDFEVAAAWDGNPVGRMYKWLSANSKIFYDTIITKDTEFAWDTKIAVDDGDILVMTPAYSDRNFVDTATGLPLNVFCYAGSPAPAGGGTDFRPFPVLRTLTVFGDAC